ncbi:DUF6463 family protein [Variovorax sp. E3]|uniref:DUF6463 family protein n=1 Tax=Variovorax sp. E3 TaxID=1914993 RepID=UPI0018DEC06D|nr:DUF6463 family protein [Variovorax sp. E3]
MLIIVSWFVLALGIVHCVLGLVVFRKPIAAALGEGLVDRFSGIPERRVAFWFTIFGPLLIMSGHIAVLATQDGNLALLRVVGVYLLVVSALGAVALPKSPFSVTIVLAALLVAGSFGWLA